MRVSYLELEATPAIVVQDWILDMEAEIAASVTKSRWGER